MACQREKALYCAVRSSKTTSVARFSLATEHCYRARVSQPTGVLMFLQKPLPVTTSL